MACHALYVEDAPEDARLLAEAVASTGVDVALSTAENAREALEAAASDQSIDVIVLDWNLPELSGTELLSAIRGHRPSTPVFVFTGAPVSVTMAEVQDEVETVLAKPFTIEAWEEFARLLASFCEDLFSLSQKPQTTQPANWS